MKLRLIRHATLQIELAGRRLLVDPMFAEPGSYISLTFGSSAGRNPKVPLPCSIDDLSNPDIIVITHTHFDHFDSAAKTRLPKNIPLVCQAGDLPKIRHCGFSNAIGFQSSTVELNGIHFTRTSGRHGKGIIGFAMGKVSGFIIKAEEEPLIYIAGDTIWTPDIQAVLEKYEPDVIIVNTGEARFNVGSAITMTASDVVRLCRTTPEAKVIAVHLDAINHCRLNRAKLSDHLAEADMTDRVIIPEDGETIEL